MAPVVMNIDEWRGQLERINHPQMQLLMNYLNYGVDIGINSQHTAPRFCRNLISAFGKENEEKIEQEMNHEIRLSRRAGPFKTIPFSNFQCSPIGAVPKNSHSTKLRVIHHLSYPRDYSNTSINSQIMDIECEYLAFSTVCRRVVRMGKGCLLSKFDISEAFKYIRIRKDQQYCLGMRFKGLYYYERCLPFGLKSAPALFELFATAINSFINKSGVVYIYHYMDDFICVSTEQTALKDYDLTVEMFAKLNITLSPEKLQPPTTRLEFLGLIIDTNLMEVQLPEHKLKLYREELAVWAKRGKRNYNYYATRTELQSLLGKLVHASRAVYHGKTFYQRLLQALRDHNRSKSSIYTDAPIKSKARKSERNTNTNNHDYDISNLNTNVNNNNDYDNSNLNINNNDYNNSNHNTSNNDYNNSNLNTNINNNNDYDNSNHNTNINDNSNYNNSNYNTNDNDYNNSNLNTNNNDYDNSNLNTNDNDYGNSNLNTNNDDYNNSNLNTSDNNYNNSNYNKSIDSNNKRWKDKAVAKGNLIKLNPHTLNDIRWWHHFIQAWNGIGLIPPSLSDYQPESQHQLYTDACRTGMGAFFQSNQYTLHTWDTDELNKAKRSKALSMPYLELLALVHSINIWKEELQGKALIIHCDCEPIVKAINSGRSYNKYIMSLLRTFIYITSLHNIFIHCVHIAGVTNIYADLLSRSTSDQEFLNLPQLHGVRLLRKYILPLPVQNWFKWQTDSSIIQ